MWKYGKKDTQISFQMSLPVNLCVFLLHAPINIWQWQVYSFYSQWTSELWIRSMTLSIECLKILAGEAYCGERRSRLRVQKLLDSVVSSYLD